MTQTYGRMNAPVGERCTNPGQDERFTTPCCYADVTESATECPECKAPIECTVEQEPVAVCTITTMFSDKPCPECGTPLDEVPFNDCTTHRRYL